MTDAMLDKKRPFKGHKAKHFLFETDADGRVATITLNRPERKNPLTFESYEELGDLFRSLHKASDVRAIVLTGAGDNFCSGPTCTAFLSVTCKMLAGQAEMEPPPAGAPPAAAPPVRPARVRFDHPRNAGMPADWCSFRGLDCGWGGANKFCATRGFDRAVDFSTYRPGVTAVAGTSARCQGPHCVGLRHVVCEHQAAAAAPSAPPEYSSTWC